MRIISRITGQEYETKETMRIFNQLQYCKFIKNGAEFIDYGVDERDRFYLTFIRKDVQPLVEKWNDHTL